MGFLGALLKTASAGYSTAKFASRGPVRGAMVGAGIGGVYGGLTSDSNNINNRISDMFSGAVGGALVGAGAGSIRHLPRVAGAFHRSGGTKAVGAIGASYAKLGLRTANLALRYPKTALGIAGAGLGVGAYIDNRTGSPTMHGKEVDKDYARQGLAAAAMRSEFLVSPAIGSAQEMTGNFQHATMMEDFLQSGAQTGYGAMTGVASAVDNRTKYLTGSTMGLVQGLHNGRH